MQASRETALDELKDQRLSVRLGAHGREAGQRANAAASSCSPPSPARSRAHGPLDITGNSSVSDNVIRRQLTFRPGELYRQSKLLESQRKLYALEVFQFANVQPVREEGEQPLEIPDAQ